MEEKKKRSNKTSRSQYEIYLNELENNMLFRENKYSADEPDYLKKTWKSLAQKLNSSGGPVKDEASWKKVSYTYYKNNYSFCKNEFVKFLLHVHIFRHFQIGSSRFEKGPEL